MHTHSVDVTLQSAPTTAAVRERLAGEDRLFLVPREAGIDGAGALKEYAMDRGRPRGDLWENCIWAESVNVSGRDVSLFQNVHQEADVVPENIDAIRAMTTDCSASTSVMRTNESLGVGLKSLYDPDQRQRDPVAADD
jgi:glyceraldehyde-3-phosphate dehydrogenase (NAD(P))